MVVCSPISRKPVRGDDDCSVASGRWSDMTDPRLQYAFVGLMALMFLGAIIDGNTILALVVGVTTSVSVLVLRIVHYYEMYSD